MRLCEWCALVNGADGLATRFTSTRQGLIEVHRDPSQRRPMHVLAIVKPGVQ